MVPLPRVAAALLGLAAPALAGGELHVGPGRTYATIDAALAAAQDGDLVVVDPGIYPAFTVVDLAVTITSAGGAAAPFTLQQAPGRPAFQVLGLAAARTVTVLHAAVAFVDGSAPAIALGQCAGAVRLCDVAVDLAANLPNATARAAVEIAACPHVWCTDLRIAGAAIRTGNTAVPFGAPLPNDTGLAAVQLVDSGVLFDHVVLHAFDNPTPWNGQAWGGDALRMVGNSDAWVVRAFGLSANLLRGGNGSTYGGCAVQQIAAGAASGISLCGPTTLLPGSGNGYANRGGQLGLDGDRGIVQSGPISIDRTVPACVLELYGSTTLAAPELHLGTTASVTVGSPFARPFFLVVSTATTFLPGPAGAHQVFALGAGETALLGFGNLTNTALTFGLQIPNALGLIGLPLCFQAVLGPPVGQGFTGLSLALPAVGVVVP